jgi:hypothetical protein
MLRVQQQPPDDKLVCSKHVEDSVIETNKGNRVCILLVILTYTQKHPILRSHFVWYSGRVTRYHIYEYNFVGLQLFLQGLKSYVLHCYAVRYNP